MINPASGPISTTGSTWPNTPIVHVHSQDMWHSHAGVVGNTRGLLKLFWGVLRALVTGRAQTTVFVNDGEGYDLVVIRHGRVFELAVPYGSDIARERSMVALRPYPTGTIFGPGPLLHKPLQLKGEEDDDQHGDGENPSG